MYEVMISRLIQNVFLSISEKKEKKTLRRGHHMNVENQWKELAMLEVAAEVSSSNPAVTNNLNKKSYTKFFLNSSNYTEASII